MTSYTKNQTIVQAGEPFVCFHIITEGSVAAVFDSTEIPKSFTLKKGDVIGIFDFGFKEYSLRKNYYGDSDAILMKLDLI